MSTNLAKPSKVAIIGASGTYGTGILARAEEIGVKAVVITRSPHKFKEVKRTTTVVEAQLDEVKKLAEALTGCDGVISALGDDRKKRPKTHNLPNVWNAMKAAGVTKYIGMGSGAMMMPGEKRGGFQLAVQPLLMVLKLFGVDLLEQNKWERDSLLGGKNGADGIRWVITRPVRPTKTPFVGAYAHKNKRGPMNCSIYDHGDFCLYCVASSRWDSLAPHVSTGLKFKKKYGPENRYGRD
jgi:nucleoside-diphosphate-sugar epimerase